MNVCVHVCVCARVCVCVCVMYMYIKYLSNCEMLDVYGFVVCFRTKGKYGDDGDKFTFTMALLFFQCIINAAFAQMGKSQHIFFASAILFIMSVPVAADMLYDAQECDLVLHLVSVYHHFYNHEWTHSIIIQENIKSLADIENDVAVDIW